MKKIIALLPFFFFMLLSCNSGSSKNNPKEVLTEFFAALSKKDIQKVKELATADSEGMINLMQMSTRNMEAPIGGDQFNPDKLNIGEPTIENNIAKIPVTEKSTGETVAFNLKKEDGGWKVAFDMSTIVNMVKEKLNKAGIQGEDIDSFMKNPTGKESEEFNKHLDSITNYFKGTTEEKIKKAKEILDKNPKLKKEQTDKMLEELQNLQKN